LLAPWRLTLIAQLADQPLVRIDPALIFIPVSHPAHFLTHFEIKRPTHDFGNYRGLARKNLLN
jgi:hypothetical protein